MITLSNGTTTSWDESPVPFALGCGTKRIRVDWGGTTNPTDGFVDATQCCCSIFMVAARLYVSIFGRHMDAKHVLGIELVLSVVPLGAERTHTAIFTDGILSLDHYRLVAPRKGVSRGEGTRGDERRTF